jgi:DNA polymerase III epsilon subunit-like protein
MSVFTPERPLGQDVQELLLVHPEGLTSAEIRRLLRKEKGRFVNEDNLQELLRHPIFVALSNGRYALSVPESHATEPQEGPGEQPFIANLPHARQNYVAFDLETTGADPARDRIIQIAALKVLNGVPTAICNWYVNPGDVSAKHNEKHCPNKKSH